MIRLVMDRWPKQGQADVVSGVVMWTLGKRWSHFSGVVKLRRKKSGAADTIFSLHGENWRVQYVGGKGPFLCSSVAMRKEFPLNTFLDFLTLYSLCPLDARLSHGTGSCGKTNWAKETLQWGQFLTQFLKQQVPVKIDIRLLEGNLNLKKCTYFQN